MAETGPPRWVRLEYQGSVTLPRHWWAEEHREGERRGVIISHPLLPMDVFTETEHAKALAKQLLSAIRTLDPEWTP